MIGQWRLISHDPRTQTTVWHMYQDGQTIIKTQRPVDPIIEMNKALKLENQNKRFGELQHVASIPLNIAVGNTYLADAIRNKDEASLSRWLNDGDNASFRTFNGKV